MKSRRAAIASSALVAHLCSGWLLIGCSEKKTAGQPGVEQAVSDAVDVYVYGYSLVTMDMTRRQMTNVATADAGHAPMGQLVRMRTYPAVDYHAVTAPNADTLYTTAWIDVSKEPWVFSIPDMGDRYYLLPMLDGWTDVFQVPGKRTTGGKAQKYAITGPGWSGTLPQGVTEYKSPTGLVWILGRIYCTGTPEDYAKVHALQDKFSLVPLSSYGKPYTPLPGEVDASFDMKTAVREQVDALSVDDYFNYLARLMKTNPPANADAPMVEKMKTIGIEPGKDFNPSKLGAFDKEAIKAVPKLAQVKIMEYFKKAAEPVNGWMYLTHITSAYTGPTIFSERWLRQSGWVRIARRMRSTRPRTRMPMGTTTMPLRISTSCTLTRGKCRRSMDSGL